MESSLYTGAITHRRFIPKSHGFSYPFFMYYLKLDEIEKIPSIGRLFSTTKWAFNRFFRPDYYGDSSQPLHVAIKRRMAEITGEEVKGPVYGLMNMRTLGLYFSPVNFYYGFNEDLNFTHFLAEVSNIPWNERYQYAHFVEDGNYTPTEPKQFKVSPFNPVNQQYTWSIQPPGEAIGVELGVNDERGLVFEASLALKREPLSKKTLQKQLFKKPVMTASIVAGIYWQALRLYLKQIPYIPYEKEMI
jgi:uncharacterized protein